MTWGRLIGKAIIILFATIFIIIFPWTSFLPFVFQGIAGILLLSPILIIFAILLLFLVYLCAVLMEKTGVNDFLRSEITVSRKDPKIEPGSIEKYSRNKLYLRMVTASESDPEAINRPGEWLDWEFTIESESHPELSFCLNDLVLAGFKLYQVDGPKHLEKINSRRRSNSQEEYDFLLRPRWIAKDYARDEDIHPYSFIQVKGICDSEGQKYIFFVLDEGEFCGLWSALQSADVLNKIRATLRAK